MKTRDLLKPLRGIRWVERLVRRWWPKPKGRIITVGTAIRYGENVALSGWSMDCKGNVPMIEITHDNEVLWCGYTKDELIEISARKDEWQDA